MCGTFTITSTLDDFLERYEISQLMIHDYNLGLIL
jgi:hypothetical protein